LIKLNGGEMWSPRVQFSDTVIALSRTSAVVAQHVTRVHVQSQSRLFIGNHFQETIDLAGTRVYTPPCHLCTFLYFFGLRAGTPVPFEFCVVLGVGVALLGAVGVLGVFCGVFAGVEDVRVSVGAACLGSPRRGMFN